jgi:hypothetical protein
MSAKLLFFYAAAFCGIIASAQAQVAVYIKEDDEVIGEYNSDGKAINSRFITGLPDLAGLLVVNGNLLVGNSSTNVSEYNASTGALINADFITGLNFPAGMAVSGNSLYVVSTEGDCIGVYDATTGATINPTFITGLAYPVAVAISDNNLFVTNNHENSNGNDYVSEYDTTSGALINANFIQVPPANLDGLAINGDFLLVSIHPANRPGKSTISEYNVNTGELINADFITVNKPHGIAVSGTTLFVTSSSSTIYEFDATTGAKSAVKIERLNYPFYIAVGPIN